MTTNFINGLITNEIYYNFLNKVFINVDHNNLYELLVGILPLMPIDKAFYLKRYAEIVDPYGSIWPHHNFNRPIFKILKAIICPLPISPSTFSAGTLQS